ncbi:DUF1801 domain-containing protein [Lentibacter algarum]|uniref:DUF1801 domain-containing protein n=1 Tax=Lentibacter algarum TaxID=576131 RepID=UPI001C091A9A|nr:DUF1801 domain-containing protein [Lentibacter algarum]MBU2983071.1 DUF1801 domain-containing protein [Lentibacter algarum]
MRAFLNPAVEAVFEAFPAPERAGLMHLRELIYTSADELGVTLSEELRWGQPAYLTAKGSTLRLGLPKTGGIALFAHCQTDIISNFASQAPASYRFDGNRAVLFDTTKNVVDAELMQLIKHGLSYHQK